MLIGEFLLRVSKGYDTAEKIKHAFCLLIVSSCCRDATETLGLVAKDRGMEIQDY